MLDKELLAKALGAFVYMVSEAVLGKTRFGSWLGLAKATVWFTLGTLASGFMKVFRRDKSAVQPKKEE